MIQSLSLLCTFGTGIVLALLGSVKLPLAKHLNIDDAKVGGLISALMFSCTIAVLLVGPAVDILGHKPITVFGFLLCAVCIAAIAYGKTYSLVVAACLIMGLGGMAISSVGTTLAPTVLFEGKNEPAAVNLAAGFYGLGAFLAPMTIALLLRKLGYSKTVSLLALIIVLPVIVALTTQYPQVSPGFNFSEVLALLKNPAIIVASLFMFCYMALETSMGGWVTTYQSSLGSSDSRAGMVLSSFWVSIMVSRLAAAFWVNPDNGLQIVIGMSVLAIVGIVLMLVAKSSKLGALAVVVIGLAFGPILPNVFGDIFASTDQKLHGTAFGVVFATGLFGASIIPAAIGIYSKGKTIQKSMRIALVTAVAMLVLAYVLWKI